MHCLYGLSIDVCLVFMDYILKITQRYQRGRQKSLNKEDREDHDQQNETKDKHREHTTLH